MLRHGLNILQYSVILMRLRNFIYNRRHFSRYCRCIQTSRCAISYLMLLNIIAIRAFPDPNEIPTARAAPQTQFGTCSSEIPTSAKLRRDIYHRFDGVKVIYRDFFPEGGLLTSLFNEGDGTRHCRTAVSSNTERPETMRHVTA